MKVLLLGPTGLLGSTFSRHFKRNGYEYQTVGRSDCDYKVDLYDRKNSLREVLATGKPDVVINCFGLVDIEACERDINASWLANVEPVATITEYSKENQVPFIHVSTDHFFTGAIKSHTEKDKPRLLNIYAKHKYCAEQIALICDHALVLRTAITGIHPNPGRQTLFSWAHEQIRESKDTILFTDAYTSLVDTQTLVDASIRLLEHGCYGLFNVGASEVFSKSEFFVQLAQKMSRPLPNIKQVTLDKASTQIQRANSLGLNSTKATSMSGYRAPSLDLVLDRLLKQLENHVL